MKKILLFALLATLSFCVQAQKLSFNQLEEMLNLSLNGTEEKLFLTGYTFLSKEPIPETEGTLYTFTNRKNTIGTAKRVARIVYSDDAKALIRYTTYDRGEFELLRKQMVEYGFERNLNDKVSENSNYYKENLHVQFEVTKDQYENPTFLISLSRDKALQPKAQKKFSLRSLIKK